MSPNVDHPDRRKCSIPDVQCDGNNADPFGFYFIQQMLCKMEPGRRRGNGSPLRRIYRLIGKPVIWPIPFDLIALDIGRKRDRANTIKRIFKIRLGLKPDGMRTIMTGQDLTR